MLVSRLPGFTDPGNKALPQRLAPSGSMTDFEGVDMGKRTHRWTPPPHNADGARPAVRTLEETSYPFGGSVPEGTEHCIWPNCRDYVFYEERAKFCWTHNRYVRSLLAEYDEVRDEKMRKQIVEIKGEYAELTRRIEAGERIEDPHNQRFLPGWVYYLELDGLIKIGFSKDVKKRMRQYAPTAKLLAAEPGTLNVERERHQHFAAYLARGREWFRDVPELRDWITTLRTEYGTVDAMAHKWTGPDRPPVVAGKRHNRR